MVCLAHTRMIPTTVLNPSCDQILACTDSIRHNRHVLDPGVQCENAWYSSTSHSTPPAQHTPGVDLEDIHTRCLVGVGELNLAVYSPGAQQRSVQDVNAIGGHEHLQEIGGEKWPRKWQ